MLAGALALVTATVALRLQGSQISRRFFAGLISIAVTLSVFTVFAWAATAIVGVASLPLIWALIMLAILFALRLYRELQSPPRDEQG